MCPDEYAILLDGYEGCASKAPLLWEQEAGRLRPVSGLDGWKSGPTRADKAIHTHQNTGPATKAAAAPNERQTLVVSGCSRRALPVGHLRKNI